MAGILIPFAPLAVSLLVLLRNRLVYKARMRVIGEISRLSQADIDAGREWSWRYEAFDAGPGYDVMIFKFWRPASAFHRGAPYLK